MLNTENVFIILLFFFSFVLDVLGIVITNYFVSSLYFWPTHAHRFPLFIYGMDEYRYINLSKKLVPSK